MKTGSTIVAGVFFLLITAITTQAQEVATAVAKVLPTSGKGVIKLLVSDNPGKTVSVRFYNEDGLIASDLIKGKDAKGFIKKYDLSRVIPRQFWMTVDTENSSFTYAMTRENGGIVAELREATQKYPVIASR